MLNIHGIYVISLFINSLTFNPLLIPSLQKQAHKVEIKLQNSNYVMNAPQISLIIYLLLIPVQG